MDINVKIKEVKERVKDLTSHFPYSEEDINYLTLAYMAFNMLDESMSDLIDEVLTKVYCLFTDMKLEDAYERFIDNSEAETCKFKDTCAIFDGYYYDDGILSNISYIIISSKPFGFSISTMEIIDSLIHELKHAINEVIIKESGKGIYSGLGFITTNNKLKYEYFDEAFNSFLTKIYLDNINYLKKENIEDEGIKKLLDSFSMPKVYDYSYDYLVKPSLLLFKSRKLFWALYNMALYKNNTEFRKGIEEIFGKNINYKHFMINYNCPNFNLDDILDLADYSELEEKVLIPFR